MIPISLYKKFGRRAQQAYEAGTFLVASNVAGLEFGGAASVPSLSDFDYLKTKGINHVRLPFAWERLQPVASGPLDTAFLTIIQNIVNHCESIGMKVMLDCHNYAGFNPTFPQGSSSRIGDDDGVVTIADFVNLWERIATVFVGHAGIWGYDIMNEPVGMQYPEKWNQAAQAVINAVRLIDTSVTMYIEGYFYSSAPNWMTYNANFTITDPNNNFIISPHCYLDRDSSGTYFNWDQEVAFGDAFGGPFTDELGPERLAIVVNWAKSKGYKLNLGENGVPNNDPRWLSSMDKTLAYCQQEGIEYVYWAAGSAWGSYPKSINLLPDGKDRVQTAVLTKYTGAPQPTKFYADAPQRATTGQPVPITVEYRGLITEPLTVGLSDNGAGGTFAQSSVTFPVGFNGSAQVNYTPPTNRKYTFSPTNTINFQNISSNVMSTFNDVFNEIGKSIDICLSLYNLNTIYGGYTLKLRRPSDLVEATFGFDSSGWIDRNAIAQWVGGTNEVPLVVEIKSQTTGNAIYTAYPDYRQAWDPRRLPKLIMTMPDGYPAIWVRYPLFSLNSPLSNITGHCFAADIYHQAGETLLRSDAGADFGTIRVMVSGLYSMTWNGGTGSTADNDDDTASIPFVTGWHQYSGSWKSASVAGMSTHMDGVLINEVDTTIQQVTVRFPTDNTGTIPLKSTYTLGNFEYYFNQPGAPSWTGLLRTLIVGNQSLTNAQQVIINNGIKPSNLPAIPAMTAIPPLVCTDNGGAVLPPQSMLRGFNLARPSDGRYGVYGWDYHYPIGNSAPSTNELLYLQYYKDSGMNSIRLAFSWENMQPTGTGPLSNIELNYMIQTVQQCRTIGMHVILEPHNYGALFDIERNAEIRFGVVAEMTPQRYANFWSQLANVFKNMPNVVYNLMNEPVGMSAQAWKDVAVASVNAIRATGSTQLIQIPGNNWTGAHSWTGSASGINPATGSNGDVWRGFTDINFVFEMHQYLDSDNSGTSPTAVVGKGSTSLVVATEWARHNGYKIHLGEFGFANNAQGLIEGDALVAYMEANADVWAGWSYFQHSNATSYMYNIIPSNITTTPVDSAQMTVLKNYLP
jgi:aryl-phospho-beta-D-glucosidase BglC (GH1 family)